MGGSSGTSAPINTGAVNQNNQAQAGLQQFSGAGGNSHVQDILSQYASGKSNLQDALGALKGVQQNPVAPTGTGGQAPAGNGLLGMANGAYQGEQNNLNGGNNSSTQGDFSQGAIDQLFSSPETAGMVAQGQVMNNPLYAGLFGSSGLEGQAEQNSNTAMNNYDTSTSNLASDRNALSGRDPSYGLQSSDLAAYGQASNNIGRNSAMQQQGIAQALAARGLGSSNNGAAIGSYAGAYGNQAEQLAGLQQQIAQNRIQTAQGLAQARNNSDLQQQQTNAGLATSQGNLANSIGNTGMNAYNSQVGNNMAGVQNDYNQRAGAAGAALNNQTGMQNLNNSQFSQQQATKTPDIGTQIGNGLVGGLSGGVSGGISKGLTALL